ncbi:hypothetical protein CGH70_22700 [Vibrio parahaemolyticus]|nr:hypothetical protein CGH70_22700 [Vibrio parahaemolyticus]
MRAHNGQYVRHGKRKANKQFKSDSPRLAFLVWVKFSVYGVQLECCGCVAHTLIGRYAFWEKICSFTKQMNIRHFAKTCIVSTSLR